MNPRSVVVVFLLALVILVGVPESFAEPQYLTSLKTVYGDGSCGTCHVKASGGGARNSYGKLFESQANHAADPAAALTAIGAPPTATTPGFEIVAAMVGLFAYSFLAKRQNK